MSSKKRFSTNEQLRSGIACWAEKMNVHPEQIRIQSMKRKWASCSSRGWVTFNPELIKEPRAFQDYVIVHELLHLEIPNHGKLFKSMMNLFLPGRAKQQQI